MSTRRRVLLSAVATALMLVVLPSSAFGQATRTWVSGVGDDVNPCSRTAPCKTFAGAISKTAAKGEINALDSGGFGAVTITKAITIRNRGAIGGVLTNAANAINVSAGVNDRVTLQGLQINGLGTASNGIRYNSGKVLRVIDCDIQGFTVAGISAVPSTANSRLFVLNSHIFDNQAGSGIAVRPTAAGGQTTIRRTLINDNAAGVVVNGDVLSAVANVYDSSISDNAQWGVLSLGSLGVIRIGRNQISGNDIGIQPQGGTVVSFGNNEVAGNTTDGSPSSTIVPRR